MDMNMDMDMNMNINMDKDQNINSELYKTAFEYVKNKHSIFTFENCLLCILDDNIPEKYVIPVGFLSIRLIDKHSNVFNDMKSGLSENMKKSIMDKISQKLSQT